VVKAIDASLVEMYSPEWAVVPEIDTPAKSKAEDEFIPPHEQSDRITALRQQMITAAEDLEYERAAELRDRIKRLERQVFGLDAPPKPPAAPAGSAHSGRNDRSAAAGRDDGGPSQVAGAKPRNGRARRNSAQPSAPRQGRLRLTPDPQK